MNWLPQEVIRRKSAGLTLSDSDIQRFVRGITDNSIGEGQIAAFAMAVMLKGMTVQERVALALAMRPVGKIAHRSSAGNSQSCSTATTSPLTSSGPNTHSEETVRL